MTGTGYRPRIGAYVDVNVTSLVTEQHYWQFGTVTSENENGTYNVTTYDAMYAAPHAVQPAGAGAGSNVQCLVMPYGGTAERWFSGVVVRVNRDSGEDATNEIISYSVRWTHIGVRSDQLRRAHLFARFARSIPFIYPVAMLCVLAIAMVVVTDNQKSRGGGGPRAVFAVITPTGCDPAVGRKLYGNDTSVWWGDGGWQFFQRVGMCPAAGIVQGDPTAAGDAVLNYQGCLDFQNADLWQGMDALNSAAGVTSNLVGAARYAIGGCRSSNPPSTHFHLSGALSSVCN